MVKGNGGGGGGAIEKNAVFADFLLPFPPTVHSSSKSNVAGRINDRELVTLTCFNKAPALQAKLKHSP